MLLLVLERNGFYKYTRKWVRNNKKNLFITFFKAGHISWFFKVLEHLFLKKIQVEFRVPILTLVVVAAAAGDSTLASFLVGN